MKTNEEYCGEILVGFVTIEKTKYGAYQYQDDLEGNWFWKFQNVTTRFVSGNDFIAFCANGQCYRLIKIGN